MLPPFWGNINGVLNIITVIVTVYWNWNINQASISSSLWHAEAFDLCVVETAPQEGSAVLDSVWQTGRNADEEWPNISFKFRVWRCLVDVICKQSFLSWHVVGNQGVDSTASTAIISGANRRYAKTILAGMCWTMLDNFKISNMSFPFPPKNSMKIVFRWPGIDHQITGSNWHRGCGQSSWPLSARQPCGSEVLGN